NMHRYLWQEICDHKLRHVVHGQRHGGAAGTSWQRVDVGHWKLDGGVCDRRGSKYYCRDHGADWAQTLAPERNGEGLKKTVIAEAVGVLDLLFALDAQS